MARTSLIGSRIRERRITNEIRQTDLAKSVGISPAYLNLIEHNRRRIGGKLLLDIADVLGVEPALLSEGAEAALLSALQHASADNSDILVEDARVEEFAGRFPGWAQLIVRQNSEIANLKDAVEALNDRLSHDPFLATALHEVISTVSSIQSSASILVESEDIEKEWRDRFHRNIFEDSSRLAETSESLVGYLDPTQDENVSQASPIDDLDKLLIEKDFLMAEFSSGTDLDLEAALNDSSTGLSGSDRLASDRFLASHAEIVSKIPDAMLAKAEGETEDPAEMAALCGASIPEMFHRLAFRPNAVGQVEYGYLSADMAGAFLSKRSIDGFSLPRLGGGCALWPLFDALTQPTVPISEHIRQAGRDSETMRAFAIAVPENGRSFSKRPRYVAHMLLRSVPSADANPKTVGVNCRICPVENCAARREMSILSNGF